METHPYAHPQTQGQATHHVRGVTFAHAPVPISISIPNNNHHYVKGFTPNENARVHNHSNHGVHISSSAHNSKLGQSCECWRWLATEISSFFSMNELFELTNTHQQWKLGKPNQLYEDYCNDKSTHATNPIEQNVVRWILNVLPTLDNVQKTAYYTELLLVIALGQGPANKLLSQIAAADSSKESANSNSTDHRNSTSNSSHLFTRKLHNNSETQIDPSDPKDHVEMKMNSRIIPSDFSGIQISRMLAINRYFATIDSILDLYSDILRKAHDAHNRASYHHHHALTANSKTLRKYHQIYFSNRGTEVKFSRNRARPSVISISANTKSEQFTGRRSHIRNDSMSYAFMNEEGMRSAILEAAIVERDYASAVIRQVLSLLYLFLLSNNGSSSVLKWILNCNEQNSIILYLIESLTQQLNNTTPSKTSSVKYSLEPFKTGGEAQGLENDFVLGGKLWKQWIRDQKGDEINDTNFIHSPVSAKIPGMNSNAPNRAHRRQRSLSDTSTTPTTLSPSDLRALNAAAFNSLPTNKLLILMRLIFSIISCTSSNSYSNNSSPKASFHTSQNLHGKWSFSNSEIEQPSSKRLYFGDVDLHLRALPDSLPVLCRTCRVVHCAHKSCWWNRCSSCDSNSNVSKKSSPHAYPGDIKRATADLRNQFGPILTYEATSQSSTTTTPSFKSFSPLPPSIQEQLKLLSGRSDPHFSEHNTNVADSLNQLISSRLSSFLPILSQFITILLNSKSTDSVALHSSDLKLMYFYSKLELRCGCDEMTLNKLDLQRHRLSLLKNIIHLLVDVTKTLSRCSNPAPSTRWRLMMMSQNIPLLMFKMVKALEPGLQTSPHNTGPQNIKQLSVFWSGLWMYTSAQLADVMFGLTSSPTNSEERSAISKQQLLQLLPNIQNSQHSTPDRLMNDYINHDIVLLAASALHLAYLSCKLNPLYISTFIRLKIHRLLIRWLQIAPRISPSLSSKALFTNPKQRDHDREFEAKKREWEAKQRLNNPLNAYALKTNQRFINHGNRGTSLPVVNTQFNLGSPASQFSTGILNDSPKKSNGNTKTPTQYSGLDGNSADGKFVPAITSHGWSKIFTATVSPSALPVAVASMRSSMQSTLRVQQAPPLPTYHPMFPLQSPTHASLKQFHSIVAKFMKSIIPFLSPNWRSECVERNSKRGLSEKIADQLITTIWQNTQFHLRDPWLDSESETIAKKHDDWVERQQWDNDINDYLKNLPTSNGIKGISIPSHVLSKLYWSEEERQELRDLLQRNRTSHIEYMKSNYAKWIHQRDVEALKLMRHQNHLPVTSVHNSPRYPLPPSMPLLCVDEVDELDQVKFDPSSSTTIPIHNSNTLDASSYDWQSISSAEQVDEAHKRSYDEEMVEKILHSLEEKSFREIRKQEAINFQNYMEEYELTNMQLLYDQLLLSIEPLPIH